MLTPHIESLLKCMEDKEVVKMMDGAPLDGDDESNGGTIA